MLNISLQNISKAYKRKNILNNINIEIESSKIYMILGKSGSGKSTLLNIIGLLDNPTFGKILFKGECSESLNNDKKANIRMKELGFVFQGSYLNQNLKAYENVMIPMYINKSYVYKDLKEKSVELLEVFGLGDKFDTFANELSGGEQQRVAIARAIANNPSVIIADEPTGNLDRENELKVMEYFKYLSNQGKSVVVVTHNEALLQYANKSFYLENGKLEEIKE
ncbi:MAG: ABC transporter ATP-binding protein [Peptostreptococcaceae bacterium]